MNLQEFFKENPKVALAFSGGVDSSYLLYAAMKYGADVKAYYVKALFQPQFEMDDAMRLAEQLKAPVRVLRQMYSLTRLWFPTRPTAAITARRSFSI